MFEQAFTWAPTPGALKARFSDTFDWLSSVSLENRARLNAFHARMVAYYSEHQPYYEDISFTRDGWAQEDCYLFIRRNLPGACSVLEVGCGNAFVLDYESDLARRYTGLDFSASLLERNQSRHPGARFVPLASPTAWPLEDGAFGTVFSTWVIEHCVEPARFLDECCRVLVPGGIFLLLCPDFLGLSRMVSQSFGYGPGGIRSKVTQGHFWDAIVTGLHSKIVMRAMCAAARRASSTGHGFWINMNPRCFGGEAFEPDIDAVYLTYAPEMLARLAKNGVDASIVPVGKGVILLSGRKRPLHG